MTQTHYVVKISSSNSPAGKKWAGYCRLALLEVDADVTMPAMISTRARGVRRILDLEDSIHIGRTERSAGRRRLNELQHRAEQLNNDRRTT